MLPQNAPGFKVRTPIFVNGRVVGHVDSTTFRKTVCRSRHLLRSPGGWASDLSALEAAQAAGAKSIEITDIKTGAVYRAAIVQMLLLWRPLRPRLRSSDWAMRRGYRYGTILVDLERHRVIDLLPSRAAEVLSRWLEDHPQISLVSRDRSPEYRAAITDTLPEALQVVDRWHLVKNLREALERSIEDVYLKPEAQDSASLSRGSEQALRIRFPRSGADEQLWKGRREQRIQRYQIVQELKSHGMSIRRISRLLGLARGTVRDFYFADTYPETQRQKTKPNILDPYLPYLEQRVQDSCSPTRPDWTHMMRFC